MVLYFSGTGNSKYLAELMAKRLGDEAIDAAAMIKAGEHPSFESEKPYVFVSPVYAWRMPRVLEGWIKDSAFGGNKQAYFVLSCGDSIGAAGNYVKKFAAKRGFEYMGTAAVVMPENYIVMFSAPPEEEDEGIIASATDTALALCDKIEHGESFAKEKITLVGHLCSDIVTPMFYTFYIGAKRFYSTEKCISCGKCVNNCMLNNIKMKEGAPAWGRNCTHCMACISRCPTEAIEYGRHTVGLRRYIFPEDKNREN